MSPTTSSLAGCGMRVCAIMLSVAILSGTADGQDLKGAAERVAQLEKELAMAKAAMKAAEEKAASGSESPTHTQADEAMENELMTGVGTLRQSLGEIVPAAHLRDTTVKRARPIQGSSTYESEINFNVADKSGRETKLSFKVQSGVDGRWQLPDVAVVHRQVIAFINRGQTQALLNESAQGITPLPLPVGVDRQHVQIPPPASKKDTKSFVIGWDAPQGSAPQTPQTVTPAPVDAPVPPQVAPMAQGAGATPLPQESVPFPLNKTENPMSTSQPKKTAPMAQETVPLPRENGAPPQGNAPSQPVPALPSPSAPGAVKPGAPAPVVPAKPSVPAPVMPVKQDVQIRFE